MIHVTHTHASYHTREHVMLHECVMSRTYTNYAAHTRHQWVMWRTWKIHVTSRHASRTDYVIHTMNESRHIYKEVMSHKWIGHVTHMNGSCHIHEESYHIKCSYAWLPATHCNTLQETSTHCNTKTNTWTTLPLQNTATHCNPLQPTATHCNTLQHTATHCNTLQHTPTQIGRASCRERV